MQGADSAAALDRPMMRERFSPMGRTGQGLGTKAIAAASQSRTRLRLKRLSALSRAIGERFTL
jgi:hypothetical protein